MKRILAVVISILLLLSVVSCSKKAVNQNTESDNTDSKNNVSSNTGQDVEEPIEFSIFYPDYNRRIPPADAPIVQQVFEKTGVTLKWITPPAEALERLNIMLATDDLPDLIHFWDSTIMEQFIISGKLLDLEEMMKKNAPQAYKTNYTGFIDRIRSKDGKVYFLPGGYTFGDASDSLLYPETDMTFVCRTGLLEELDWYNPSNFDKIFELLKTCQERYPEMIPMSLALGPQGHLWSLNVIGAGAYGLTYSFDNNGTFLYNNEVKYFSDVPEMKEWYGFLNKIYRSGLMDVESPVMSQDMHKEKVVAGKVFSWFGPGWETGSEFIGYMESQGSTEQCLYYLFPSANDSIKKTTYARITEGLYTTGLTVTSKNKDPERFLRFYEYLNTEEGWYASAGIVNWDFTGENTYERTEGYDFVVLNDAPEIRPGMKRVVASEWMGTSWNDDENWWWNRGLENFGFLKYGEGNHPLGKYDYVGDRDVGMWWDENTKRIYGAYGITGLNYWQIMTDTGCDVTLVTGLTLEPESDESIISLALDEYVKTQLPRVIVAETEAEFDKLWNEMNSKLNAEGKEKFIAKKNELFKERLEAWNLD